MSTGFSNKGRSTTQTSTQSTLEKLRNSLSTDMSNKKFKHEPEQCSPKISVKPYSNSSKKVEFHCKTKQIPANSNDATMGHNLQGMSKDVFVVTSWPTRRLAAQELGVCRPIPSTHTIGTLPS